MIAKMLFGFGW